MNYETWIDFLISAGMRSVPIAGAGILIYRVVRNESNRMRFSIILGTMVALVLLPIALTAFPRIEWSLFQKATTAVDANAGVRLGETLAVVWLIGLSLFIFRLAAASLALHRLQKRARLFEPSQSHAILSRLQTQLGWRGPVALLTSAEISRPVVCGLWRPTILLPPSATEWGRQRLERVLAHELAHVARRDLWSQWLCQVVSALYWFNPLVWKLSARQFLEREIAADELALALTGDNRAGYARELLAIATEPANAFSIRPLPAAAMLGATSRLEERIVNLFRTGTDDPKTKRLAPILAFLFGVLIFAGCSACDPFAPDRSPWTDTEIQLRLSADPFPAG